MAFSRNDFAKIWRYQGEDDSPKLTEVAWRRYQQVQSADYQTKPESEEPHLRQLEEALTPFLKSPAVSSLISSYKFVSVPSNTMPWMATSLQVNAGGLVSTFATGRLWRSMLLDLYLPPQFGLYFRVGVNGRVFNSTRDTNTFQVLSAGEIYVAPQFPGQFSNPKGGRVQTALKAYNVANNKGGYQVLVIIWKDEVEHDHVVDALSSALHGGHDKEWFGLIGTEVERLSDNHSAQRTPRGWQNLWFLGENEVYSQETFDSDKGIRCCPDRNVGILQKNYDPAVPFTRGMTVTWDWCITALPSRLREDTTVSHDYLSLGFEFENGRDLTYTWSWELPVDYGYWCPLPTWEDREYHIVIRSGTEQLGKWLSEKRDLYADYKKHIGYVNMPTQIVRVWLIAGNRWQRHKGEMLIKKVVMGDVKVL